MQLQHVFYSYDAFRAILSKLAVYCSDHGASRIIVNVRQRVPQTLLDELAHLYDLEVHTSGQSNTIGRAVSRWIGSTAFLVLRDASKLLDVFAAVSQQCQCAVFMVAAPVVQRTLDTGVGQRLPMPDFYDLLSTDATHAVFIYTEDSTTPNGDVAVQFSLGTEMPVAGLLEPLERPAEYRR